MSNYPAFQKQQRLKLGLSQKALGDRLGITDQAVGEWERGISNPTRVAPEGIAAALEVPVDEVLRALGRIEAAPPIEGDHREQTENRLRTILSRMNPEDLQSVCEFAEFRASKSERQAWEAFAIQALGDAYGDDEPEYTIADVKP